MYKEQVIRAGRTEEHSFYHSIRYKNGDKGVEKRAKRIKPTSERQALINRKRVERTLTRLLNANFGKDDLYVTWTFAKENRPGDPERFKEIVQILLKALRKLFKKSYYLFYRRHIQICSCITDFAAGHSLCIFVFAFFT